jgi:teichuronic acid biosynthesis glycosyltransferase TuaC
VLVASDRVLCVSEALERRATEIAPAAETTHLPLGATPRNFPVECGEALRRELDVPTDATVVLYCGHFSEAKGIDDLIQVLPTLTDGALYLVCIGHGGDLRWDLHAALRDSDLSGQVHWKVDPVVVRRWFALADAFVLPSYSEGRPTVIYEAMASATPVIATTVGGIPEQVVDGETGWLFEPGDVDALRSLLDSLDPDELEAIGERGRERLREQGWTWTDHAERLAAVHEALL